MSYADGKLDTILQAIVTRIIAQVSLSSSAVFNAASCYLSLMPDDTPAPNPGNFVCVVAASDGNFDEPNIDGGGQYQATATLMVRVKIHSPVQLDEYNRDATFLTGATVGIIEIWRQVVKNLMTPWFPLDGSGNVCTRDPLMPAGFSFERRGRALGAIEQRFKLTFDLDVLGAAASIGMAAATFIDADTIDVQYSTAVTAGSFTASDFVDSNQLASPLAIAQHGSNTLRLTGWNNPPVQNDQLAYVGHASGVLTPQTINID